jgi:hypothetical protein
MAALKFTNAGEVRCVPSYASLLTYLHKINSSVEHERTYRCLETALAVRDITMLHGSVHACNICHASWLATVLM